ncbi:hypothetical protein TW84_16045 [Vibrio neptunius]|uniref:DUF3289 family protein n=1 Tax=Vibrio neptunius TaxID=170651 RepID=UPI0005F9FBB5|nr:DUF3289 family protein [Vibrio neptunius]KJY87790.1 hypothetical protein TW84_16045 [Vibrio neptunius]
MSRNPPPKGRSYPFAQRGSAFWEKCHVTYDQAVDMYYDQTAMQQHLGHNPIVNSLVYKRVTYPNIFDAQRAYTQDQNAFYQKKEQEQLAFEARGIKAFKNMNDAIRGRLNPTEDGLANPLERPLKPMGDVSKGIFEQFTNEVVHEPSDRSAETASVQPNLPEIQASEDGRESVQEQWQPVAGDFSLLVFETKNKMDTFCHHKGSSDCNDEAICPKDMRYGDESRDVIESYGLMQPFKNKMRYSPSMGYDVVSEDQFALPASEHFKRMRSLANDAVLGVGFSTEGETQGIFFEMVDKFERNEGGYYSNPLLSKALQGHETTQRFHEALKKCLGDNVKDGRLPDDILSVSSQYMMSLEGERLPKFDSSPLGRDLSNGTVLSVHDIWSLRVYVERLEYKGNKIRGIFKYEVQDHFGLDTNDINHDFSDGIKKQYEQLEGFRSWYLLQHFKGYGYKPFITKIDFEL